MEKINGKRKKIMRQQRKGKEKISIKGKISRPRTPYNILLSTEMKIKGERWKNRRYDKGNRTQKSKELKKERKVYAVKQRGRIAYMNLPLTRMEKKGER